MSGTVHNLGRYQRHIEGASVLRVLVVDNEAEVRALIRDALESAGHDCIEARDDHEARVRLSLERVSLLITDIDLGSGPTGYEVARTARAENQTLPVLYVTGTPGPNFERLAVEGAKSLVKPFEVDALLAAVSSLMRGTVES